MSILRTLYLICATIGCLAAIVYIGRYSPLALRTDARPIEQTVATARLPAEPAKRRSPVRDEPAIEKDPDREWTQVATKPPYPKVVCERQFRAGRIAVDQTVTHKFRIENRGQAPLQLALAAAPCHGNDPLRDRRPLRREIPPGASTEIEMQITPREPSQSFEVTVVLLTNDPDVPELKLKIEAVVVSPPK